MPFFIAVLVFVAVTLAVFAAMSLFDQRKAQARVLRDRLSTVQKPAEQAAPDVALLRDEVLSRIPAFDTVRREFRCCKKRWLRETWTFAPETSSCCAPCRPWASPSSRSSPAEI